MRSVKLGLVGGGLLLACSSPHRVFPTHEETGGGGSARAGAGGRAGTAGAKNSGGAATKGGASGAATDPSIGDAGESGSMGGESAGGAGPSSCAADQYNNGTS